MELGKEIDKLYVMRAKRLAVERKADEMKEQEKALAETIQKALLDSKSEGTKGKAANFAITRSEVPTLVDFDAFWEWAKKKSNRDVMRVSVVTDAWRARHLEGKEAPGVKAFTKVGYSLTKV